MEFELSSDYLLKDGFDNKNNFDHLSDTLNETLPPTMKNVPESDFITDHTVPVGWSYKRVGGSLTIYSPDGLMFKSRRQIFEAMIASGKHSFEDINNMKYYLQFEGWQESDKIPFGWRIKIRQGQKSRYIFLMEQGGKRFESVSEAVRFIRTYQKYYRESDAEILIKNFLRNKVPKTSPRIRTKTRGQNLQEFDKLSSHSHPKSQPTMEPNQNKSFLKGWKSDELLYPSGWKHKTTTISRRGKKSHQLVKLLSPSGMKFRSVRAALLYMASNEFPDLDIAMMREALVTQNIWLPHEALPDNWLYRRVGPQNVEYCDPRGRSFRSKELALKSIESKEVSEKLRQFIPPGSSQKRTNSVHKRIRIRKVRKVNVDDSWKFNENIYPSGWRFKDVIINGRKINERVATDDGIILKGKRAALAFMIKNNYTSDQQEKLCISLEKDGWFSHQSLPEHWLFKKTSRGLLFSNEKGITLKSQDVAVDYLHKLGDKNLIQSLKEFIGSQHHQSQNIMEGWKSDELLYPSGWRYKEIRRHGKKSHQLQSPSGMKFRSVRTALLFMAKNEFPELDIAIMRESLVTQNIWLPHEALPDNWLYRRVGPNNVEYCDPSGRSFRSKELAMKSIESKEVTEKIGQFIPPGSSKTSVLKRIRIRKVRKVNVDDSWKFNENIYPSGWRFKDVIINGRKMYERISTNDGIILKGKRAALAFMIENNYTFDQQEKLYISLEKDGWYSHQSLPEHWLFKKTTGKLVFSNEKGIALKNQDVAVDYLHKLGHTDLVQSLKEFIGSQKHHSPNIMEERWKSDELLYPSGWRYQEISRFGRSKIGHKLLSPSGMRLPSPRAALVFMTKNSFPETDIAIMREALVTQNIWLPHEALPDNWLYRRVGHHNVEYCDPNGRSFRSKDQALKSIEKEEVSEKLTHFNPSESIQKSKGVLVRKKINVDETWNIDENIYPTGWTYKNVLRDGVKMYERIASQDGFVFRGKRAALAFMIKNDYRNEDQEKLRNSLQKDGWLSHFSLPEHWLYKNTKRGAIFSNENGIKFKNLNVAKEYLEKVGLSSFLQNLEDFNKYL